jgi:crotonobetainyl-CoA:carnitine CoA-transferase CaiB-like acyl-CoA transferase
MLHGLRDLRVIDLSTGIAGAYLTKLLADAGADVIKVEPREGDPLRRWSATGADLRGDDGALFQFLASSKRSVVGAPGDPHVLELYAGADLVVESFEPGVIDALDLCARHPQLVLLSITPYGRGGPYSNRPASDFTIQAESGCLFARGLPEQPPVMIGGRTGFWVSGVFAAVGALAAVRRARRTGQGEHVDFSVLEMLSVASSTYSDLMHRLAGRPQLDPVGRTVEIPSIEPTLDGWVGFNTNSREQYQSFLLLIERTDLLGDAELANVGGRWKRRDEWNALVRAWTTRHTTAEIVERASLLRIPVAPVNDGKRVLEHEHFKARGVFERNPRGGFLQPRPSYKMDGQRIRPPEPAPRLGEHQGRIEPRSAREGAARSTVGPTPAQPRSDRMLPLAGLRVLDATAWWAGPTSTQILGFLGAEVIHLESIQRPDGGRMIGGMFSSKPDWWERSALFLGANTNKKGLTLDLASPRGVELCKRLIARCDVVIENFSPRVFDGFGLTWDVIRSVNPRVIFARMPAFGLDGPWRDNVGFAQTMEQMTGLAWLTGHPEDQPRIQRGPCDPISGMHAAFATLVALAQRDRDGQGHFLECTMVEGALNAAAEQLVEYTAYGRVMQRMGNRAPYAAPQGLYACRGTERWLALSVESDAQWHGLRRALGDPAWSRDPSLESHAGRMAAHDALDASLSVWAAEQELDAAVELLIAHGVPAAALFDGRRGSEHPQHVARGFYETFEHPVVGVQPIPTVPFRYASQKSWLRCAAPTLGQHNREILRDVVGLSDAEIDALEAEGVIGTRPRGV